MRALVLGVVVLVTATLSAACGSAEPKVGAPSSTGSSTGSSNGSASAAPTLTPEFAGAPTLDAPNLTDDGPGSLVSVTPLTNENYFEQVDATAVRVVYRSTQGLDGPATQVSGVVAVPAGKPPRGGWPILSFGHAGLGLASACAPSLGDDVAGYAPIMAVMLSHGYVVTLSDYQGLGLSGQQHSVIDTDTLGNNLVDAVRAARRVTPTTSNRWAAWGFGEGGQASWAANERAVTYGAGLDLVGTAAMAPLADLTGLVDAAVAGTLTGEQYRLFAQVLASVAAETPDFDLDSYRSGLARDRWGDLINCGGDPVALKNTLARLQPSDLRPPDPEAAAQLRGILAQRALPGAGGLAAPLLVIYATDDPLAARAWVVQALQNACQKGETVEFRPQIGASSTESDQVLQASLDWLQARFDGQQLSDVCKGPA
jgi:alpha-beta hydrolase superfamily lysophospholipase